MLVELFAAAAVVAASTAPPPAIITRPDWAETPDGEDFGNHYPIKAWDEDVGGKAVMERRVSSSGRLNNCKVLSEEPAGYGFGDAAIGLSGLFRMKPYTIDGQAISGGWVRIPIRFMVPEPDPEGVLEDTIQCYGLFRSELDAHPEAGALVRAVNWYKESASEQAATLGVSKADLHRRLDAARAAPPRDASLIDWCRSVD